jgi:hypothetical protein
MCEPQPNRRDSKNNPKDSDNALVVTFNPMIGAAEEDQRSLKERGAGLLIIILAGALVLFWAYNARSGPR